MLLVRPWIPLVLAALAFCAGGCGPEVSFVATAEAPSLTARSSQDVTIVYPPEEPPCSYRVVGNYTATSALASFDGPRRALRDQAAARGFDGVIMTCGNPGTVRRTECEARAYVCRPAPSYAAATTTAPRVEKATIAIVGDFRDADEARVLTAYREGTQFIGELTGRRAMFTVELDPGEHVVTVADLHEDSSLPARCHQFVGTFEAGKTYVASLLTKKTGAAGPETTRWIFPRPQWTETDPRSIVADVPRSNPDLVAGQAFLDGVRSRAESCRPIVQDSPSIVAADFGFDVAPWL